MRGASTSRNVAATIVGLRWERFGRAFVRQRGWPRVRRPAFERDAEGNDPCRNLARYFVFGQR